MDIGYYANKNSKNDAKERCSFASRYIYIHITIFQLFIFDHVHMEKWNLA